MPTKQELSAFVSSWQKTAPKARRHKVALVKFIKLMDVKPHCGIFADQTKR